MAGYAVAHLDEIDEFADGRCHYRPIRHHLGITAFGAYHKAFHDVTAGNNTVRFPPKTISGYQAARGWDAVTAGAARTPARSSRCSPTPCTPVTRRASRFVNWPPSTVRFAQPCANPGARQHLGLLKRGRSP
jgi:hypothetical protein